MNISVNGNNNYTAGRDVHIYAPTQNTLEAKIEERDMAYHAWKGYKAQSRKANLSSFMNVWAALFCASVVAFVSATYVHFIPYIKSFGFIKLATTIRAEHLLTTPYLAVILPAAAAFVFFILISRAYNLQQSKSNYFFNLQCEEVKNINRLDSEIEYLQKIKT